MATAVIVLLLAVIVFFALRGSLGHFKGEGGCCGGGGGTLPEHKELEGPSIGEKIAHIEGMHCENCKNRVERAINRIDGAVGRVDLKTGVARITYDREIPDGQIVEVVAEAGYEVTSIVHG